jgi:hypothetical protein
VPPGGDSKLSVRESRLASRPADEFRVMRSRDNDRCIRRVKDARS